MAFSTYLYWRVQRYFQNANRGKDKVVDIYDADGKWVDNMPYSKYKYRKAKLYSNGYTGVVRTQTVYIEDNVLSDPTDSVDEDDIIEKVDAKMRLDKIRGKNTKQS